jgi:hypothetical protein
MFQNLKLAGGVLALSLAFAANALPKDNYHAGPVEAREHGYEHGYRDGFHEGLRDRDHHEKFKPDAKDADAGYEGYMGSKDRYREGYRTGFNAGYDDGFNGRPGRFTEIYGPIDDAYRVRGNADRYDDVYVEHRWGTADVAYDIGFRDGLAAGSDDFHKHRIGRPNDLADYRAADHGYRPSYGDKDAYQRRYREGFEEGYHDGSLGIR